MKKILALTLSALMVLAMLPGCQKEPNITPTQSPEEQAVLKVLTIGNSHSLDATWLLGSVLEAEDPNQKWVLGTLYVSGCNMSQHADFALNNKAAYEYFKNSSSSGTWTSTNNVPLKTALLDEQWDVVVMQQMNHRLGNKSDFSAANFKVVINCILENQEVKPKLAFHMTWTNPDDYALYLNSDAPLKNPDPGSWRQQHEAWFRSANGKYDQSKMYEAVVANVKKYLVDTTEFLGKNYYDFIIPSATAVEYAQDVLGRPQPEIYRDYTHLNDYGRLVAAYLWYAQLIGIKSIDKVNMDIIMPLLHHANSQYPSAATSYILDDKMKSDLIASVNWALSHPYELPTK